MRASIASIAGASAVCSRATPIAAVTSSTVPYASTRRSYFLRYSPFPSIVEPASPARV
jgi:hypothetical protein